MGVLVCNISFYLGYWSVCKATMHTINVVVTLNHKPRASPKS